MTKNIYQSLRKYKIDIEANSIYDRNFKFHLEKRTQDRL